MEKVKIKNGDVIALNDSLLKIISSGLDLSPRNWFTMSANKKILEGLIAPVEETRLKLVEKHGEEGEDGMKRVTESGMKEFLNEYNELMAIEVEVGITKLLLKDLEKDAKRLTAVENILVFFTYMVSDEERVPTKKSNSKKLTKA